MVGCGTHNHLVVPVPQKILGPAPAREVTPVGSELRGVCSTSSKTKTFIWSGTKRGGILTLQSPVGHSLKGPTKGTGKYHNPPHPQQHVHQYPTSSAGGDYAQSLFPHPVLPGSGFGSGVKEVLPGSGGSKGSLSGCSGGLGSAGETKSSSKGLD